MGGNRLAWLLRKLGLDRPEARAWAMYDWANSAMVTTIVTAIFPIYFLSVAAAELAGDEAQARYSEATVIALATIAVLAPVLGALADIRAAKKRFLAAFALMGVLSVAGLFFVGHGEWKLGLVLFALANIGAAGSVVFYDSLLPHVAAEGRMDQLSTSGYALGYVGGGLLLALNLAWVRFPQAFGLPAGEGLSPDEETLPARLAFLSVALWWGFFTIPILRRVKEPSLVYERDEAPGTPVTRLAFQRVFETFKDLRRYRQAFLMLLAFLIYNDGIATVIRMAAIYATDRDIDEFVTIGTILIVQFVGIPFSFLFGHLAGSVGAKRMVTFGLIVYAGICVFAYFMETDTHFVLLGLLVAVVQGGTQGLSRSLFGSMVPRHKSAEFFAFFAIGEKFAGIFGPLMFLLVISLTGTAQNAILSIMVFFVIGGAILLRVNVDEGRRLAAQSDAETWRP